MIALVRTPPFDWEALAPLVALGGGMVVALVLGLLPGRSGRFHCRVRRPDHRRRSDHPRCNARPP